MVEDFSFKTERASEVTQALLHEIIPCFGLPHFLQNDNEEAFISQITQEICKPLQIIYLLHSAWHHQSSGKVEKANGLLKRHRTKFTQELLLP